MSFKNTVEIIFLFLKLFLEHSQIYKANCEHKTSDFFSEPFVSCQPEYFSIQIIY